MPTSPERKERIRKKRQRNLAAKSLSNFKPKVEKDKKKYTRKRVEEILRQEEEAE